MAQLFSLGFRAHENTIYKNSVCRCLLIDMKTKQLANILIKILGLSVCIHAIPTCVSGIIVGLTASVDTNPHITFIRIFSSAAGAGIQALVGIIFIAMSQKIVGWMFNSDDE